LHVPIGFQPRIGALVVALHGAGDNGQGFERSSGLSGTADQAGFAVVYPDGLFNPRLNATDWQYYGNDFSDDVGFLRQLIAVVTTDIQSDPRRTYIAGFSDGGRLAHRAGVELSDLIAAIGDVGGSLFQGAAQVPAARGSVSVVILHGDEDAYCGGPVDASQDQTFDYWAGGSGDMCARVNPPAPLCDSAGNITMVADKSADACTAGTVVKIYRLFGGRHAWYGTPLNVPGQIPFNPDLDASTGTFVNDVIWNFFAAHPKS
jgi:polyhydroxybutyrate depolymerase